MGLLAESNSLHKDTQQPPFRFTPMRGKTSSSLVSALELAAPSWRIKILSVIILDNRGLRHSLDEAC